jgi:protein-S-isoprenylcysteine O-methyltransferase Ste14
VRAYLLVAGQFALLLVLVLWRPRPRWTLPEVMGTAASALGFLGAAWLVLGAVSLGRSLSAVPLPVVHGRLMTGGLFRLSRHPIYTGLLAIAWSVAVRAASPYPLAVAVALTVLLHVKARFEEAALREAYPEYAGYAARTPRFLPRLLPLVRTWLDGSARGPGPGR